MCTLHLFNIVIELLVTAIKEQKEICMTKYLSLWRNIWRRYQKMKRFSMLLYKNDQQHKIGNLTKGIYRFIVIPIISHYNSSQISKEFFSTSYGETNNQKIAKTILYNKRISCDITNLDFKLYHIAIVKKNNLVLA